MAENGLFPTVGRTFEAPVDPIPKVTKEGVWLSCTALLHGVIIPPQKSSQFTKGSGPEIHSQPTSHFVQQGKNVRHRDSLKVDDGNHGHPTNGIEIIHPHIIRHAVGVKIVEHGVADKYTQMATVLRDCRLPAIVAQTDHKIAGSDSPDLNQLTPVAGRNLHLLDVLSTRFTI
jgi:hypothetical protein